MNNGIDARMRSDSVRDIQEGTVSGKLPGVGFLALYRRESCAPAVLVLAVSVSDFTVILVRLRPLERSLWAPLLGNEQSLDSTPD